MTVAASSAKALVLAYGVHEPGYREVIALDVGEAETEAFWRAFLRELVERGLTAVSNDQALIRLAASIVIEQNDEWLVGRRSATTRSKRSSIKKRRTTTTERRHASSPRPEQPTIPPTSCTTSWDLTVLDEVRRLA